MGIALQGFIFFLLNDHMLLAVILAFLIVLAIIYVFELVSKITGKVHYDVMDAVASAVGGITGMCMVIVIRTFL